MVYDRKYAELSPSPKTKEAYLCDHLLSLDFGDITHGLPRSGELRTQKLKSHLVRTQSLNVLPLKAGVGQYVAKHALTARDFVLPVHSPAFLSKTFPEFFLC